MASPRDTIGFLTESSLIPRKARPITLGNASSSADTTGNGHGGAAAEPSLLALQAAILSKKAELGERRSVADLVGQKRGRHGDADAGAASSAAASATSQRALAMAKVQSRIAAAAGAPFASAVSAPSENRWAEAAYSATNAGVSGRAARDRGTGEPEAASSFSSAAPAAAASSAASSSSNVERGHSEASARLRPGLHLKQQLSQSEASKIRASKAALEQKSNIYTLLSGCGAAMGSRQHVDAVAAAEAVDVSMLQPGLRTQVLAAIGRLTGALAGNDDDDGGDGGGVYSHQNQNQRYRGVQALGDGGDAVVDFQAKRLRSGGDKGDDGDNGGTPAPSGRLSGGGVASSSASSSSSTAGSSGVSVTAAETDTLQSRLVALEVMRQAYDKQNRIAAQKKRSGIGAGGDVDAAADALDDAHAGSGSGAGVGNAPQQGGQPASMMSMMRTRTSEREAESGSVKLSWHNTLSHAEKKHLAEIQEETRRARAARGGFAVGSNGSGGGGDPGVAAAGTAAGGADDDHFYPTLTSLLSEAVTRDSGHAYGSTDGDDDSNGFDPSLPLQPPAPAVTAAQHHLVGSDPVDVALARLAVRRQRAAELLQAARSGGASGGGDGRPDVPSASSSRTPVAPPAPSSSSPFAASSSAMAAASAASAVGASARGAAPTATAAALHHHEHHHQHQSARAVGGVQGGTIGATAGLNGGGGSAGGGGDDEEDEDDDDGDVNRDFNGYHSVPPPSGLYAAAAGLGASSSSHGQPQQPQQMGKKKAKLLAKQQQQHQQQQVEEQRMQEEIVRLAQQQQAAPLPPLVPQPLALWPGNNSLARPQSFGHGAMAVPPAMTAMPMHQTHAGYPPVHAPSIVHAPYAPSTAAAGTQHAQMWHEHMQLQQQYLQQQQQMQQQQQLHPYHQYQLQHQQLQHQWMQQQNPR